MYAAHVIWGQEYGHGDDYGFGHYIIRDYLKFSNRSEGEVIPTVIRPVDIGFNILAGYGFKRLAITLGFSHGITGVFPDPGVYGTNYKNEMVSLSVGYIVTKRH
jgi:hypothetical protein